MNFISAAMRSLGTGAREINVSKKVEKAFANVFALENSASNILTGLENTIGSLGFQLPFASLDALDSQIKSYLGFHKIPHLSENMIKWVALFVA